ncbi:type VII toxin-antitoxin system MntA family adenylyltransferase antitoxin [Pseudomonas cannabina]|uniref:DNA polymerase beta subunit n=1 Tax=Pseudomonas cannabina TaxID=86840 RepID=A0A0P9L6N6_PSECA|nr:nucleotidyltransferase domain-containing protein [Pseudomonas cannabina]KAA8715105.1 nucleotidyltransferase domain-containing protein [Pseudomonas cannabina]KPW69976.1 DNA polymerase beta subunit [Pseudomonas cannabina]RMN42870.1 DNA polymerase beta subunit [Pseudomonas cannabina]SDQ61765.1 Predicted nucleotidyltransferase [Pseudomonas cannabina]
MDTQNLLKHLQSRLPDMLAVYLFGSQATGHAGADSDLDLAVLVPGTLDPIEAWRLAGEIADIVHLPVDLIDLRTASTVMQYQIITKGRRLWGKNEEAGIFEAFVLSEKTSLDSSRAGLLEDIQTRGVIHGR